MLLPGCSSTRITEKDPDTVKIAKLKEAPLKKAAYSFPVEDIQLINNTISFTIPSDARQHDKKSDAVVLSGMYATDKKHAAACPIVDSHYVDKKVKSYKAFSGKAEVVATFDDPKMAKRAAKAGCLLVYDAA